MQRKLLPALLFVASANLWAEPNAACLLEGKLTLAGQTTELKDCIHNRGLTAEQFKQTCEGIAQLGATLGAPPKISYLEHCPQDWQGACNGLFGQPVEAFYYKRTTLDIADVQNGCTLQQGKWTAGK